MGRIGSISYVLPIRQNIDILNRDRRVLLSPVSIPLKFSFSKKATKFELIIHLIWRLLGKCQITEVRWNIVSNFCGLFRMSELYHLAFLSTSKWSLLYFKIKRNTTLLNILKHPVHMEYNGVHGLESSFRFLCILGCQKVWLVWL